MGEAWLSPTELCGVCGCAHALTRSLTCVCVSRSLTCVCLSHPLTCVSVHSPLNVLSLLLSDVFEVRMLAVIGLIGAAFQLVVSVEVRQHGLRVI